MIIITILLCVIFATDTDEFKRRKIFIYGLFPKFIDNVIDIKFSLKNEEII